MVLMWVGCGAGLMRFWYFLGIFLGGIWVAFGFAYPVSASTNYQVSYRQLKPQQVGTADYRFLFWDVFSAALYAPKKQFAADRKFMLELTYQRPLTASGVADATITEMQRLGYPDAATLEALRPKLEEMFADIKKGTRIAAIRTADGATLFVRDGQRKLGSIRNPHFAQYFFQIWLGEDAKDQDFRRKLLGNKPMQQARYQPVGR
ncbi:MAG: hypothetical protein EBQ80_03955 [Proteobacteria bacterium]|nr:hypothetical protein [Pseudomonadota bacterium]